MNDDVAHFLCNYYDVHKVFVSFSAIETLREHALLLCLMYLLIKYWEIIRIFIPIIYAQTYHLNVMLEKLKIRSVLISFI